MGLVMKRGLFLCVVCLVAVCGCMKPPVRWRYDQGPKNTAAATKVGLVLPVEDVRPAQNEESGLLRFVPLVLWTTERDDVFDLALLENGSRFGSLPAEDLAFRATSSLHEAARLQLAASGDYGPVFGSASEVGAWSGDQRPLWVLTARVEELQLSRRSYRYGLGPLAFLVHALGAPTQRAGLTGRIELRLVSEDAGRGAIETLAISERQNDGWYRSLEVEQRLLDHLARRYRESLETLIDEVRNQSPEVTVP